MKAYLSATLQSLGNRNFRLFFAGQTVSIIGTWMQKIAQAWLVLDLTDSGALLGVTAALQQLPTLLFAPWGGLLADRMDKRRLLVATAASAAVPSLALAVLIGTGTATQWMVFAFALLGGCIDAIDKPARQTFVIEMVGRDEVANAVALNNVTLNAGKLVGPAVAGLLITSVGLQWCFLLNALSFGAVLIGLVLIRADLLHRADRPPRARGQVRDGLRYVRGTPELLGPLALMTVTGLFAYNWSVVLPLLARQTFHGSANVAGLMYTAMGAGAIIGALAIAATLKATSTRLVVTGLGFAAALGATAASPRLTLTLALLFVLGTASVAFRAVASSLLQLQARADMRGRVMSLLVVAIGGTTPIGGPLVGWIAEQYGTRAALALAAVTTAAAAGGTMLYLRHRAAADEGEAPTAALAQDPVASGVDPPVP